MINMVGIRVGSGSKISFFDSNNIEFKKNDFAIVETSRGVEIGKVVIPNKQVEQPEVSEEISKVIRKATDEDMKQQAQNEIEESKACKLIKEKVKQYNLNMKIVKCEYTFDKSKLLAYFTAEDRIDFRELVKDIASIYKTRIELRQIGARDEVKLVCETGICGKQLCCGTFLNDFESVSIKMAKEQGLSLNPTKISGMCGRLMCCLKYEQEVYEEKLSRIPKMNSLVTTPDGNGFVSGIEILSEKIKVKFGKNNDETVYKTFDLKDITFVKEEKKVANKGGEDNGI